jgi:DNA-directed RNA polymerase II subunit RPB1
VCAQRGKTYEMLTYSLTRDVPVRPKRLRFSLLSADEIRRMSVCQVTETTLYYRGLPASGGLLDPLMGSVDRRHLCASCMRDARTCQGHAGHLELAYPMYHLGYVDTVLKVLRTVCFCCSRVCLDDESAAEGAAHAHGSRGQLAALHATLRTRKACPHCGMTKPTYSRLPLGIKCEWPEGVAWESDEEREYCTRPFTAREALSILTHMTDEDVALLGLDPKTSHPKHMVLTTLVVPPPCTRPAIYSSEGSRSRGQNDLTIKFLEILKRSHELRNAVQGAPWRDVVVTDDVAERLARLQYEVFTLVNNNVRGHVPTGRGVSTVKSLTDRLKGKEVRARSNAARSLRTTHTNADACRRAACAAT